jgi:hypothetical protein
VTDESRKYLSLILYQDSFEIVNPLGSAKKKHKILGFYYVLGNLETHNRASIDHVQLVMIALESDVTRIGHRIFSRLVNDLAHLENEGLQLFGETFYVTVAAIAGDNLGSNWLGGFVTNFSSTQNFCRFCTLSKDQIINGHAVAADSQIRTPATYGSALAKLSSCSEKHVDGIKHMSPFNRLKTFHVCDPGLPPCVAHDLFEGVVAYDLPLFIRYFAKNRDKHKLFTVDRLNKRLQSFCFSGSDSGVKPPLLSLNPDRLSGSASQNWCFIRIFPLLVCDLVDPEDEVFEVMMLLRTVVELVMAPAISSGQVAYMKIVVEDYIERRQSLFPDVPLRPKHHFMSHYAMLTLQFGPLKHLWTLRFESKHQYFKRCIRYSHNFINVTRMLANRHQLLQAYISAGIRFKSDTIFGDTIMVCEMKLPQEVQKVLANLSLLTAQACLDVTVRGIVYRKGLMLPWSVQHANREIVFGEILFSVVTPNVQCVVNIRRSTYDYVYGCYIVHKKSDVQCIPLSDFADFYPLPLYETDGHSVVVLKHQLLDTDN